MVSDLQLTNRKHHCVVSMATGVWVRCPSSTGGDGSSPEVSSSCNLVSPAASAGNSSDIGEVDLDLLDLDLNPRLHLSSPSSSLSSPSTNGNHHHHHHSYHQRHHNNHRFQNHLRTSLSDDTNGSLSGNDCIVFIFLFHSCSKSFTFDFRSFFLLKRENSYKGNEKIFFCCNAFRLLPTNHLIFFIQFWFNLYNFLDHLSLP